MKLASAQTSLFMTGRENDKLSTAQLDSEGNSQLGELKRVGPGEAADSGGVAAGVDVGVAVGEGGLEGEGGGEAVPGPRGVVGASVPTGRVGGPDARVGGGELTDERVEVGVGVVSDQADGLGGTGLDVGGHVELEHALDGLASASVVGGDSVGAEQTSLLTSVEVELEGSSRLESALDEHTGSIHEVDGSSAIIISTRGARSGTSSDGVHVSTENGDWASAGAGEGNDSGGLGPGVSERADSHVRSAGSASEVTDSGLDPGSSRGTGGGGVVTVVVAGELVQPSGLLAGGQPGEQRGDRRLLRGSRVGCDETVALNGSGRAEALLELIGLREIEEASTSPTHPKVALVTTGRRSSGTTTPGLLSTVLTSQPTPPVSQPRRKRRRRL